MDPNGLERHPLCGARAAAHMAGVGGAPGDIALHGEHPHVLRSLLKNRAGSYGDDSKPCSFLISPHLAPLGHPPGVDPPALPPNRLVQGRAAVDEAAVDRRVLGRAVCDHDARHGVGGENGEGAVLRGWHRALPGSSRGQEPGARWGAVRAADGWAAAPAGHPLGELVQIGKETNRLEEVEQRLVHDWDEIQLVFRGPSGAVSCDRDNTSQPASCCSCGAAVSGTRAKYYSAACKQHAFRQRLHLRRAGTSRAVRQERSAYQRSADEPLERVSKAKS